MGLGGQTISMIFGSQTHNGFAIVREMKDTSQHCCEKTMDDKMSLYRVCCFTNSTRSVVPNQSIAVYWYTADCSQVDRDGLL